MSFKVLVIPEDPTYNGYILKPLVEAILADVGKPKARVHVLTSPHLHGFDQAKEAIRGEKLTIEYGFYDLWLFIPDADRATPDAMRELEKELTARNISLVCCPAQPEVEIYACVAYRDELGVHWQTVRSERDMKEKYFAPLLSKHGDWRSPGGGREKLIKSSLTPRSTLYQFCPELAVLRDYIAQLLT